MRIPAYDYAGPGAYFVTLVTQDRACLSRRIEGEEMQLSLRGRVAEACWTAIPEHFPTVELGTYVVMPNHVHGIRVLHDGAATSSPHVGAAMPSARRGTI